MVSQKKQVKRLKKDAQRLWSDQQDLVDRAKKLGSTAAPHVQGFAKDTLPKVVPTATSFVTDTAAPAVGKAGRAAGGYAASTGKDALTGVLLPAVSSAAGAAVLLAEEAGSRLGLPKDLVKQADKATDRLDSVTKRGYRAEKKAGVKVAAAAKAGKAAAKHTSKRVAKATGRDSGIGVGGVLGILLGVGLLVGIGYAVWQTLRADDDLWVADEDPDTTGTADAAK